MAQLATLAQRLGCAGAYLLAGPIEDVPASPSLRTAEAVHAPSMLAGNNEAVNSPEVDEAVLLLVERAYAEEAIALRDPARHAVLPIGPMQDDKSSFLLAMGARDEDVDLRSCRYGNVCVVAPVDRQPTLIAFVASAAWSVIATGWLHACEPPYARLRARPVSLAAARAALDAVSRGEASALRPGLPRAWSEIADRVRSTTGRELVLQPPPAGFSSGPEQVEVRLDGERLGSFGFWWDDKNVAKALADLRNAVSLYLDEEFHGDDWWGTRHGSE